MVPPTIVYDTVNFQDSGIYHLKNYKIQSIAYIHGESTQTVQLDNF